jgi:UDP-N-acetylglucosamine 2-epimerase
LHQLSRVSVGNQKEKILEAVRKVLSGDVISGRIPEKRDRKAAERIVEILLHKNVNSKR